ncbi:MAG: molybdate ABC transporter substrate-binding protein [Bacteroidetes bacterium]|nr:MAG: molybdate ABC transporter substrate-binding protein [Bacteroidota bacterium]TAG89130.1 MAG: molybdate ABC transporter substrate-binding protein [Bacteroidota bacterium]
MVICTKIRLTTFLICILLICKSCHFALETKSNIVRVAISGSAISTMKPIAMAFKQQNPTISIDFVVGTSGNLAGQLRHSHSFDVFICSDTLFTRDLYVNGNVRIAPPLTYAYAKLLLITQQKTGINDWGKYLTSPRVKKICIPNTTVSSFGYLAQKCLEENQIWDKVKNKIITADGTASAFRYMEKQAVEAVFLPQSFLFEQNPPKNYVILEGYNVPQGALLCSDKEGGKRFYEFLSSPVAQRIMTQHGYIFK